MAGDHKHVVIHVYAFMEPPWGGPPQENGPVFIEVTRKNRLEFARALEQLARGARMASAPNRWGGLVVFLKSNREDGFPGGHYISRDGGIRQDVLLYCAELRDAIEEAIHRTA